MSSDFGLAHLRDALDTLQRLRDGWRPDECLLANARYAQHWVVTRQDDAAAYQFVGSTSQLPVWTFTVIATVLAIDPSARWALLFGGGWIVIGDSLPTQSPFDPADVAKRGETWLLSQIQQESSQERALAARRTRGCGTKSDTAENHDGALTRRS